MAVCNAEQPSKMFCAILLCPLFGYLACVRNYVDVNRVSEESLCEMNLVVDEL